MLDVSAGAFAELKARFEAVQKMPLESIGVGFGEFEGRPYIAIGQLAIRPETMDNVRAYLVYQGKLVKGANDRTDNTDGDRPSESGSSSSTSDTEAAS